jgi:hypothetical protein
VALFFWFVRLLCGSNDAQSGVTRETCLYPIPTLTLPLKGMEYTADA